ncbi:MAG: DUF192 domain-containing protein, partial [Candidatus Anstonellales archaeon]
IVIVIILFLIEVSPQQFLKKVNQKAEELIKKSESEILSDEKFIISLISKNKNGTLIVNNNKLKTELAISEEEQRKGFMNREKCNDCAILFMYERKEKIGFWMKNVSFDLLLLAVEPVELNISNLKNSTTILFEVKNIGLMARCNQINNSFCPIYTFDEPYSFYIEIPYQENKYDLKTIKKNTYLIFSNN